MKPYYDHAGITIYHADCRDVLPGLSGIDFVLTDPPYGLSFMGKAWDHGVPGVEFWQLISGACKPGAHLLAFGGTRTFHRLTCAIEDAAFEIRDCLGWIYGSGFPKSLDVSKAIDKAAGVWRGRAGNITTDNGAMSGPNYERTDKGSPATDAAREWNGWGTALKPAWEPIILARKPFKGSVAGNVLGYGTGAINIDACRIPATGEMVGYGGAPNLASYGGFTNPNPNPNPNPNRFPANLIHDGSEEVMAVFPETGPGSGNIDHSQSGSVPTVNFMSGSILRKRSTGHQDLGGSAARFFYCAKASGADRGEDNNHPTVKPSTLMRYLCQLIAPPDSIGLDPFMGSGTTLLAAKTLGFKCIGIDMDEQSCEITARRLGQEVLGL